MHRGVIRGETRTTIDEAADPACKEQLLAWCGGRIRWDERTTDCRRGAQRGARGGTWNPP